MAEMSAVMPLLEMADSLPQSAPRPKLPKPLECLEWEGRIDKWGLLNPGTWLDQPKWFMEDVRAASISRDRWRAEQHKQYIEQYKQYFMPKMTPGITR